VMNQYLDSGWRLVEVFDDKSGESSSDYGLTDRPFNLKGGGLGFVHNFFFGQHKLEYLFFLSRAIFFSRF
jgi:hypothetical protein